MQRGRAAEQRAQSRVGLEEVEADRGCSGQRARQAEGAEADVRADIEKRAAAPEKGRDNLEELRLEGGGQHVGAWERVADVREEARPVVERHFLDGRAGREAQQRAHQPVPPQRTRQAPYDLRDVHRGNRGPRGPFPCGAQK
jgi:hypothetical protein